MSDHAIMQYALMCTPCVQLPTVAREIPWNWSHKHLLATMWILGIELRSSAKATVLLNTEPSFWPQTI